MRQAATAILESADHMGFKLAMMLPAWGQLAWGWSYNTVAVLGSGLFSLANIVWVYALSRRLGAPRVEARWSAFLMAASVSMFYWSRHLMPYDMALFWGLGCMYVGLSRAPRWWHSLVAGTLGNTTFLAWRCSRLRRYPERWPRNLELGMLAASIAMLRGRSKRCC
jgi:hypothetical protein